MSATPERARAVIDLQAIRSNTALLARAAGNARLMAVVKADGYGHGAAPAARAALEAGAERLGVNSVGEAEQLREARITAPILVMGALTGGEWARVAPTGAEVAVWAPEGVRQAMAAGVAGVHLKLDTGMGRLGARPEDVDALVQAAVSLRAPVTGLMTHFATADDLEGEHSGFMHEQLLRFRSLTRTLAQHFPGAVRHAANSAATLRAPETHLDMVRCGIALYGGCPFGGDPADRGLIPAMALHSTLASVKTVRSRDSVGYGRTWRAARGTRVGLVPVGYGDGYARVLGNRATALVGGRPVPVVGTVSMDQLTVDLGPEGTETVGTPVVLLGSAGGHTITAEELAALRGTINYEVTCGVGARIPRVHIG